MKIRTAHFGLPFLALLMTAATVAQTARDLCVPAPGMAAPSLPARLLEGQGAIAMPITTSNPKAQRFFNQGLAQMHSFWSTEAERSFLQAAQLDPECAMAYWGVAMAAAGDYRPAFQLRRRNDPPGRAATGESAKRQASDSRASGISGLERARQAAGKAQQLAPKASDRERLYIEAAAARRNAAAVSPAADYIAALRKVLAAYPKEVEAKSYLALALMDGYEHDKSPRAGTSESVELLRSVLKDAPDHPGAHHYVIHALEGSAHPELAWDSSRRYPELVPNIPHALHMPGHIYVQSDRWDDAIGAFESAKKNEEKYMAADVLYGNWHHGHNVAFLISTLGFQGRFDDAVRASEELLRLKETPREASNKTGNSAYRQGWFGLMRTLVRFEKWDEILADRILPADARPAESAWRHWARGLAFAAKGRRQEADIERKAMEAALQERKKLGEIPEQLQAARVELEGQIKVLGNKPAAAIATLWRAAEMEAGLEYSEPPIYPRPVLEALGEIALKLGFVADAERAFRKALEQNPGSARARKGLAIADRRLHQPG